MPCGTCNKGVQHYRPRKKKVIPSEQECYICHVVSWDVQYCGFCGKWLCPKCRRDPVKRFKGFSKEVKKKITRRPNWY